MTVYIGYRNKWEKGKFIVLATTKSKAVANFISQSYKDAYKRNGMKTVIEMHDKEELDELPEGWKYAD